MTTSDAHFKPPTKPRRRWYQFSLRTLLVGMAVVGFGTAWLGVQVKHALDQRRAVEALAAVAQVGFAEPRTWVQRNEWLRSKLGTAATQDVKWVVFRHTQGEELESALTHLGELTQLKSLDLSNTRVSDAGLAHLRGLTQLQLLNVGNTQVSDAGSAHLRESLPKLYVER